jgi:cyclic pyranopterin phosphate synthase
VTAGVGRGSGRGGHDGRDGRDGGKDDAGGGRDRKPRRPRPAAPRRKGQLHLDARGRARMVDVGSKPTTRRVAVARGTVRLNPAAFSALAEGRLSKGDALAVARLAGILAAKRTSEIVPLAHPIALDSVSVDCELDSETRSIVVTATTSTAARTGVEMEALTAVAGACLALYDMAKAIDRGITIAEIVLVEKTGGRSGIYRRGEG